jgi:lipopolysaccharide export system permease protein
MGSNFLKVKKVISMIIQRFLMRELAQSVLIVMLVLLFFVMSNMLIRTLNVAAAESIVNTMVLNIIGTALPKYVGMLLPIALFVSILIVYGKLFSDNELLICFASGLRWRDLLIITLIPSTVIFIIVLVLSLWVMPSMSVHQTYLTQQAVNTNDFSLIKPGRFASLDDDNQVIYVGETSSNSQTVSDLFIFEWKDHDELPQIVVAPEGFQEITPTGERFFHLKNGHLYRIAPLRKDAQHVVFEQYGIKIQKRSTVVRPTLDGVPTSSLWSSEDKSDISELQWRFVLPLSAYVLACMAVSVCSVKPRQGRYAKIFPGILMFIGYFNLITLSRSWIEKGWLSPMIGLWWVPGVFLVLALLQLAKMEGLLRFPLKKSS